MGILGDVLVVGGCGYFGSHLVQHLLGDDECGMVHVLDCSIDRNQKEGASYHEGSITNAEKVRQLVREIRPRVLFHCVSPRADLPHSRNHEFQHINIHGTDILLAAATNDDAVEAFVFTSSVDTYACPPHDNVDETHPLLPESDTSNEYARTKAVADRAVLAANGSHLRTVSLRPGHMYGDGYAQGLQEIMSLYSESGPLIQLGRGDNLMEVVSIDNAATLHILAAKALLDPKRADGVVAGEAFNVSDGAPVPFWHHARVIWQAIAGDKPLNSTIIIPAWLILFIMYSLEWVLWIFTLDIIKLPKTMDRAAMSYCLYTHTYSIQKAQDRLHFEPLVDHDKVLAESVKWVLRQS
jgi:sterol-4alpha-carboxylate 3-dehydrogenase (decarboxylating)